MIRAVTFSVSDTRTGANDTSGQVLRMELEALGVSVLRHEIVPDDVDAIRGGVSRAAADVELVVLTGGTGIGPRDVTPEAVEGLYERRLDGFGEAFRRLSWDDIGARAILSRASAGTVGPTLVVLLPGSTKAVRLGITRVLGPMLTHAIDQVTGRHLKHGGA